MTARSLFWPWLPLPRRPHPDAERLLLAHRRFLFTLARRWFRCANPFADRSICAEDVAAEFLLYAYRGLRRWQPTRGSFPAWLSLEARSCALALRKHAMRKKRARHTLGQYAGDELDRQAALEDPRQRQPWEIAAEREEMAGCF